jgi:hypothetical protein
MEKGQEINPQDLAHNFDNIHQSIATKVVAKIKLHKCL